MKPAFKRPFSCSSQIVPMVPAAEERMPPATRFSELVDVRNRGTLRTSRFVGGEGRIMEDAPAVVRLWIGQHCHEMTVRDACALAEQLLAAAAFADKQNGH